MTFKALLFGIIVVIIIVILLVCQSAKSRKTTQKINEFEKARNFCRNCGHSIKSGSIVCPHCGVRVGTGKHFCYRCGNQTDPLAVICVKCGVPLDGISLDTHPRKSRLAGGLFGIFLGAFGVHNFYLGYTWKAIAQLLITLLSGGSLAWVSALWGLIEGILILGGGIRNTADGTPLKE